MAKYYLSHTSIVNLSMCNYYFYSKYIKNKQDILPKPVIKENDECSVDPNTTDSIVLGNQIHNTADKLICLYNNINSNSNNYFDYIIQSIYDNRTDDLIDLFYDLIKNYIIVGEIENVTDFTINPLVLYIIMLSFSMEKTRDIFNLLLNVSSKIVDNENIKNQLVDLINNTKTEIEPYGSELITKTLTALILNITKIFKPDISLTTIESYNKTRDIFDSLSNIPKSNTIYIASEKDIASNELPNTNGFYLYGRIDTIIVYNNTIYLVDYKTTKNPIYLKLYNKDTSIENQLLMYAYILKNKDSETNIFDISDISNYKIYYMYNIIYTQNLQDPDTILSYQKYDDTAIYQFKVNIINFIKMYLIKPFMENGQFKNNIFSINDDLYVTSGLLNKSYHNECSFQPVCEYSKNISEEIKNISTPESEEIPISTTSTISSQYIRKVPDRIGIINLSYYDCVVSVYFGQKESVIENKDNAVSLNQSGQIIYDIKGEINRSIFSISFSNVNHMLEVYRYIRAQQILFNIIPIYNNFLAKSFLPYNIYSNYYVKILGSKLVSKNVLNSISLMEPSIGEDGIYYSSIYSMVPVYCNINSVKIQSIYGQTYGYTIELDLSKVSMEMLNKYDFQFAGDVATLKKILNIQQEVRGFQNPYWKIFSELYSREVDNESIDKSYRIKE